VSNENINDFLRHAVLWWIGGICRQPGDRVETAGTGYQLHVDGVVNPENQYSRRLMANRIPLV